MKIVMDVAAGVVSIGPDMREVDFTGIAEGIEGIYFDTGTNVGVVIMINETSYAIGKTAFFNLYGKYWQAFNAAGTPPLRTLDQVKTDKREQMNSKRDNLEQSGFPYQGKTIDSNPVSVQRITVAVQAAQAAIGAGQPFAITWTCQDNSTIELDAVGMMGMPVALAMFANGLHETARAKKDLIDAATTIEEVEAVTWA